MMKSNDCRYNPKQSACDIEVECAVLRESLNDAENLYHEMSEEIEYLNNRVFYLERLLMAYGIKDIYDNK
ncbi:hypothetical protein SAMN06297422_10666 [Lachnospiraceae bacterium]|nr:hypothetical protein SAMN06297422_10666 [Lachnospiraceae bacterium]